MAKREALSVHLGGEERVVRLSVGAFRYAKQRHGVTVSLAALQSGDLGVLSQILWVALLPDDPGVTEQQVLEWLMELDEEEEMAALSVVGHAMERFLEASQRLGNSPAGEKTKSK